MWRLQHEEEEGAGPSVLAFVQGHVFTTVCSLVIIANMVVMGMEFHAEETGLLLRNLLCGGNP